MLFPLLLLLVIALATAFAPDSRIRMQGMKRRSANGGSYGALSLEPATAEATAADDVLCDVLDDECARTATATATQSQLSATTNLAKCICGAGSFALPHVFLEEGVLGGILAITTCGALAAYTMQSLANSKLTAGGTILSYVELARNALGPKSAQLVFALTLSASIGVCSTYLVFIGTTLASLSGDASSQNIVRQLFPDVSTVTWETCTAVVLLPLSLLRSYGIFAFTSALGVVAVFLGILVTLASGIFVEPGGGLGTALSAVKDLPMWPESISAAFGGSFGTIAYLFCVNFLTFPIINSMEKPKEEKDFQSTS